LQLEDNKSIHFDVIKNKKKSKLISLYESAIRHDLKLRNLCTDGVVEECQLRLKEQLVKEYNYKRLLNSLNHVNGFGTDKSYVLLADCPPCILHMEMRTTLKFLQILLDDGLQEAMDEGGTSSQNIDEFMSKVNTIFNEKIFGTEIRPYTFKATFDKTKKVIDDITLDGLRCRNLIYNIQPLIELCAKKTGRRNKWLFIIENYIKSFQLVRKKENLTTEEVKEFQYHVDLFFQMYMDMIGRRGITNYFHLLGSGHVADYLVRCGNLYIHSQQGWEAFNSFLKVFYFRRTTRGGGKGSENNRIRQLARWLARRLVWNSGYTFDEILCMSTLDEQTNHGTEVCTSTCSNPEEDECNIHEEGTTDDMFGEFNPNYYFDNMNTEEYEATEDYIPDFHEDQHLDSTGRYDHQCMNHKYKSSNKGYIMQYGEYYDDGIVNSCIECSTFDIQDYYY
jgi:hypothetical protein